ncbi:MAG: EamA family transporter [Oligoflexia bacterium]|nr:EamA family transporter [Oligoflexia bacterium]
MFGIALAIISCFILTCGDAGKRHLAGSTHPLYVPWLTLGFLSLSGTIYFGVMYSAAAHLQITDLRRFLWLAGAMAGFSFIAEILFIHAVNAGDFSRVMPLGAFTPIVTMLLAWLTFDEAPTKLALGGVLLLILGAYVLYLPQVNSRSLIAPLKLLVSDTSAQCMGLVTICFAFMATLQKLGAELSSPIFFIYFSSLLAYLGFTVMMIARGTCSFRPLEGRKLVALATVASWTVGYVGMFVSFSYTVAVYAAALSKLNVLFALAIGHFAFKEDRAMTRLVPALLMLLGAALVIAGGMG